MIGGVILCGLVSSAPYAAIGFLHETIGGKQQLLLGDIAVLDSVPKDLRQRAETIVLMDAASGDGPAKVAHAWLASRARSLLPALSPWLSANYQGSLKISPSRSSVSIVAFKSEVGPVRRGDKMTVRVDVGSLRVERTGVALQSGENAQPLFIRTADNVVRANLVNVQ